LSATTWFAVGALLDFNYSDANNSQVDFVDQDMPAILATHCLIEWKVGLTPQTGEPHCENSTLHALIPDSTYKGVGNFMLNLSHTYIEDRSAIFKIIVLCAAKSSFQSWRVSTQYPG
jgi:hypothetical protein